MSLTTDQFAYVLKVKHYEITIWLSSKMRQYETDKRMRMQFPLFDINYCCSFHFMITILNKFLVYLIFNIKILQMYHCIFVTLLN